MTRLSQLGGPLFLFLLSGRRGVYVICSMSRARTYFEPKSGRVQHKFVEVEDIYASTDYHAAALESRDSAMKDVANHLNVRLCSY